MSLHYLLDGYNVIHQMPSTAGLSSLEETRKALVSFVERESPQGSAKNLVTIVFDGNEGCFGGMAPAAVKVVFSQGESADELIKRMVANSRFPKNLVVVSDDRDIQYAARALGAGVKKVKDFLSSGKRAAKRSPAGVDPGGQKRLSMVEESKITAELKNLWLRPRGKGRQR